MLKGNDLRITTIVENTVRPGLLGEWGLSVLIEAKDFGFLIDTGGGATISPNVDVLGIELGSVGTIVLSHGHFDHTGGLRTVLEKMKRESVRIVAHPEVWSLKYLRHPKTGEYSYIGIPFRREALEDLGARFELTPMPTWLTENIATSGEEPRTTSFEGLPSSLFVKTETGYEPDALLDDQSVYIRTDLGLVIVLGCAHRGMVNIIKHAQQLMETDEVYMVLGGTHLFRASDEQLDATIAELNNIDVQWLGVSHCTGQGVALKLSVSLGERFFFNNAGTRVAFPFEP